jgi:hypothetical protein
VSAKSRPERRRASRGGGFLNTLIIALLVMLAVMIAVFLVVVLHVVG